MNGQVTGKAQETVSCSHSYSCNCRTVTSGSGKNQSTSTVCDTCYEHDHDFDWNVNSNVGNITIDRVDRQGVDEPARWAQVNIGDPVAVTRDYTNWIKPAVNSLFHLNDNSYKEFKNLPEYPGNIVDYYKINRIITDGANLGDTSVMNNYLSQKLEAIGPAKQANIIIVVTANPSPIYSDAVYAHWKGAEKNDIVVFVGANGNQIRWVNVRAWSKYEIFEVKLRDALLDSKVVDLRNIIDITSTVTASTFARKRMHEFEYLKNDVQTITPLAVSIIVIIMLLIHGGSVWIDRNIKNSNRRYYR